MQPLVSVIIPTYKRPTDLKRAIDSVLNQSYSNIEIKVVDDNDKDSSYRQETEKVMEEYANHKSVEYLKHEYNRNGSAARNTGWKAAKGEYITYLDDDDEISPERIKKQVECLESKDASWGACYTAYKVIKPNGKYQISSESREGYLYVEALMRTLFMGSGSNLLLRKSVVDEINGYDETFMRNQDIEFMARALEKYKLAYIDEQLLTIHLEIRQFKRSYEQLESYTRHYLEKFEDRLNALKEKDKKRVMSVISLERCRQAFEYKKYGNIFMILKENKVPLWAIIKYLFYLIYRILTHKSYGFSL